MSAKLKSEHEANGMHPFPSDTDGRPPAVTEPGTEAASDPMANLTTDELQAENDAGRATEWRWLQRAERARWAIPGLPLAVALSGALDVTAPGNVTALLLLGTLAWIATAHLYHRGALGFERARDSARALVERVGGRASETGEWLPPRPGD